MKKIIGLLVGVVLAGSTFAYAADDSSSSMNSVGNTEATQPAGEQIAANDKAPAATEKAAKKPTKHHRHHAGKKKHHHKHHGKKASSSNTKKIEAGKSTESNTISSSSTDGTATTAS